MDVVGNMGANRDYFEDFVTRSTYHSNAIEGSTLSFAETYAVLWNVALLAGGDDSALTNMFQELSDRETERMNVFAEAASAGRK